MHNIKLTKSSYFKTVSCFKATSECLCFFKSAHWNIVVIKAEN